MNLIVFDIDDTLTRSENQHQKAFVDSMHALGISKINQDWKSYNHYTDSFILKENYENNLPHAFDLAIIPDFEEAMTEGMRKLAPVSEVPGALAVLEALVKHLNYGVAFATGSFLKPALLKLKQAGLPFDKTQVVGSNTIFEREGIVKQSIQQAKQFYQVNQFDEIIAVGDGIWDFKAAQNLGLHFLGIGMKNHKEFIQQGIQMHIEDWTTFELKKVESLFGF